MRIYTAIFLLSLILTGCSDLSVSQEEIEGKTEVKSESIVRYRIVDFEIDTEEEIDLTQLYDHVTIYSEEIREFNKFGFPVRVYFNNYEDNDESESIYTYSDDNRVAEIERFKDGQPCSDCNPTKIIREFDELNQVAGEENYDNDTILFYDEFTYSRFDEVDHITRYTSKEGDELYTTFFTYLVTKRGVRVKRAGRQFFKNENRVLRTEYGYDDDGFLIRVTQLDEIPERIVLDEKRYMNLAFDERFNWLIRIENGIWLIERYIEYY